VTACLMGEFLPQVLWKEFGVVLSIKPPNFGGAVGIRTHGTAEVARINDGNDDHQRELFRPRTKTERRLRDLTHSELEYTRRCFPLQRVHWLAAGDPSTGAAGT